jgi:aspartate/methionine/tyrosine aminotransferase
VVGGTGIITESLKILDCVAISAPRIGQEAALAGLLHAQEWRAKQVIRIRELENRFLAAMHDQPGGFEVVASGAYFGWVRHPRADLTTSEVVRRLILEHDVLVIPGTAFTAEDDAMVRMSFANLEPVEIEELTLRLTQFA